MPFFSGGGGSSGSGSGSGGSLPALSGNGSPSDTIGADGQIFIDKQNLVLYGPKTGGSWGAGIPIGATDWANVANIPAEFPPSAHAHQISDVTNLQTEITTLTDAIAAKQDSGSYSVDGHDHSITDVTGLQDELDQKQTAGSYANSIHNHDITDVAGLEAELNARATTTFVSAEISAIVGGAPAALNTLNELAVALDNSANFSTTIINSLSNKSDLGHTHSISEITNLQTTLDGKQIAGNYASSIHFHVPTDITGLIDLLNGKSDSGHGHSISEITSLQTELNSKAGSSHVHVIGDITNLQSSLDGKSDTGHVHTIANVTNLQTTLDGLADASHTHIIADINGLQSQLDGKAAASHTHQKDSISDLATSDLDIGSNKILYSNVYTAVGDLPSASTYHGMFAHVHNEGAFYASHSGNWHELALASQIPTVSSGANITVTQTGTDYEISAPPTGISWESVPATETATGSAGDLAHDGNYVYVCVTSNLWKRVALETFSGNTGGGTGGNTTGIYITQQPTGGPAVQGAYTFSIQATVPSGTISYQWQKKTGSTWSNVSGQLYSSFSLANLTTSDSGSVYRCYLTSGTYDDVISTEAVVTVSSTGVYGVTATKPGITFLRSVSDNKGFSCWQATGKNWTYNGWTLIKEQTQWEYDSLNRGDWTIVRTGMESYASRSDSIWRYGLVGVNPNPSHFDNNYNHTIGLFTNSGSYSVTTQNQTNSQNDLTDQLDVDEWTYFSDPSSPYGKWNRAARFRTRVILQKFENNVETQVTTEYSEWSDWCADPGGNTFSDQSTVFTTQPTAGTLYPGDVLDLSCEIAGTNKRYLWKSENSYEKNDWFAFNWYSTSSDTHNAASADLTVSGHHLGLSDVGLKTIKCLGASDWNKASFSNSVSMSIPSTSDTDTTPVVVDGMGISVKYGYQNYTGTISYSGTNYYIIPHIKLKQGTDRSLDMLNTNYGMSPYHTATNFGKIVMSNGIVRVNYEYTDSYSSNAEYQYYGTLNQYIGADGRWIPSTGYVQTMGVSNNYATLRVRFCLISMDVVLLGDSAGVADETTTDLTTVWSEWHYYQTSSPS